MGWNGSRFIRLWIAVGWLWGLSVPLLMCCTRRRRQCLRNCPGRNSWEMLLLLAKLAAMVTVFQGSGPHYTEWLGRYKKLQLRVFPCIYRMFFFFFFKATHDLLCQWGVEGIMGKKKKELWGNRWVLSARWTPKGAGLKFCVQFKHAGTDSAHGHLFRSIPETWQPKRTFWRQSAHPVRGPNAGNQSSTKVHPELLMVQPWQMLVGYLCDISYCRLRREGLFFCEMWPSIDLGPQLAFSVLDIR